MLNPLITVITPAYNVATFVAECIDSVLSQTVTNFEMIVVDDGSRDRLRERDRRPIKRAAVTSSARGDRRRRERRRA